MTKKKSIKTEESVVEAPKSLTLLERMLALTNPTSEEIEAVIGSKHSYPALLKALGDDPSFIADGQQVSVVVDANYGFTVTTPAVTVSVRLVGSTFVMSKW